MSNMSYGALPPGLKVGDTIAWVNHDTVIHSVTARDKSFDLRINPGQTMKMTLAMAGKFPFYCLFHPTMRGTLTVDAK
jgi:plastocyanin